MTLLERLEAAEEGSRELDREIACAVGHAEQVEVTGLQDVVYRAFNPLHDHRHDPMRYTEFVDHALTLVPEGWHVDCLTTPDLDCLPDNPSSTSRVIIRPDLKNDIGWAIGFQFASAKTPALALCIAALRARETCQ